MSQNDNLILLIPEPKSDYATEEIARQLGEYFIKNGPLPNGSVLIGMKEYEAIGRVDDCDCKLIQCVCSVARQHRENCRYRKSLTCAIAIPCEPHGNDVCAICDACDCGGE